MTKAELMKLATALADAEERVRIWGMMNGSRDPEQRLKHSAEYRIAQSVLDKARDEYCAAIADLSAAQLDELMRGEES